MLIGKSLPKIDSYAKVTGAARYADDIKLPRMAFGRILRSPHPHARIVRLDTSRARAYPGVLDVITGADLPIKYRRRRTRIPSPSTACAMLAIRWLRSVRWTKRRPRPHWS